MLELAHSIALLVEDAYSRERRLAAAELIRRYGRDSASLMDQIQLFLQGESR